MRKFSVVLIAVALLLTGSIFANTVADKKPAEKLSAQISKMLVKNSLNSEFSELTAVVRFTLNENKEIVILSVATNSQYLEGFLKNKLNYKKVELDNYREGKIYTVPVKVTK